MLNSHNSFKESKKQQLTITLTTRTAATAAAFGQLLLWPKATHRASVCLFNYLFMVLSQAKTSRRRLSISVGKANKSCLRELAKREGDGEGEKIGERSKGKRVISEKVSKRRSE